MGHAHDYTMHCCLWPRGTEGLCHLVMSGGTGGVILFIQQLGIVGLIPFNNSKVDLTCVPVSGGDLIGWETSHHHHIGFAEVRSGRIVDYREHIGRQARGTFVALCIFKGETGQGVFRARGNRMCPVTMT